MRFIDSEGINWQEMIEHNDFSSGYYLLIQLAMHLFGRRDEIDLLSMLQTLDSELYSVMKQSIEIRKSGIGV